MACALSMHCAIQPSASGSLEVLKVLVVNAGVDGSTRIAAVAKRLVAANGMADSDGGSITVLQGRLEELPSLPVEQVCALSGSLLGIPHVPAAQFCPCQ